MKSKTVVLSVARTPFGRLGGALAPLGATTLGGEAIRNAVRRAGIDPAEVEHVIMGLVIQAGVGQAPARQAAFKAGLAKTTTADTVNKVCASGMLAVAYAAKSINAGDARRRGRRHGVDVERAVSAARRAHRLSLRRCDGARRDDPRRPVGLLLQRSDGGNERQSRRRTGRDPRTARRVRLQQPRARSRAR
jgi:hypothetical protein